MVWPKPDQPDRLLRLCILRANDHFLVLEFDMVIYSYLVLEFQVVPRDTCVPCGGSAVLNCSTTALIHLGGGRILIGAGGQLWRIQNPDGTVTSLSSSMPSMVPAGYEFISSFQHQYTGLWLLDTNSTWNGTTFQCIAFNPTDTREQNNSAAAVTLEVGSECRMHILSPCLTDHRCFITVGYKPE